MSTVITSVDAGSPAERAGIRAGEQLLMINHHEIVDVLDYRFFCYDPSVSLRLREADGTTRHLTIEKEEGEDLGLNFDTYLMDEPRPCSNHCLFCFVDQMPPNMRDTLYFKDDDARLSFLMGNYITLTNLTEREAQRIIDLRISPINVSVQATEPQLRRTLLGNKDADKSLEYMRAFGEACIEMNGQIVVCPGWNDGEHLRRSIEDLMDIGFNSCSIVPVGLTKFRKGLARLEPVTKEKAGEIIRRLLRTGVTRFRALFQGNRSRSEVVATFLAVLELCKAHRLRLAGTEEDCTITSTQGEQGDHLEVTADSFEF